MTNAAVSKHYTTKSNINTTYKNRNYRILTGHPGRAYISPINQQYITGVLKFCYKKFYVGCQAV